MTGSHAIGDEHDDTAVTPPDSDGPTGPRLGEPVATAGGPVQAAGGEPGATPDGEQAVAPPASAKPRKKPTSMWRELPVLVVVALLLAFLIKTFLVQAFYIPSESMENTLLVGDRVLVNKLSYRFGEIQRGDVVVFDGRDSFEPARTQREDEQGPVTTFLSAVAASFGLGPGSESDYIKRVIGVGGDHVVCCDEDGRLTVNGDPVGPEDYLYPGDEPSATPFDITVPADRIWVMGDHRSRSEDSRAHTGRPGGGTVSVDRVVGRAFVKVWPLNRIDLLSRPDSFDGVQPASP